MKTSLMTAVALSCVFLTGALADEATTVLSGRPSVQYQVDSSKSQRTRLSPEDSTRNALVIVRIGEDYFWKTRGNRRIIHIIPEAGGAHYFIDPEGGGYVKIMARTGGTYTYLEHVGMDMTTYTYFGTAETFTP